MNPVGRKRSFYFPDWMTREVEAVAARLDRSVSWILQRAWKLARADMHRAEPRTPAPVRDESFTPTPSPTFVPGTELSDALNGSPSTSDRSTRP
jgi:uncharacterized small protein (TIGR04563 family)